MAVIDYAGTSIDPSEQFIRARVTSVGEASKTGNGKIAGVFRTIPAPAREVVEEKIAMLKEVGIGDNINDEPMLTNVDLPILVQSLNRKWHKLKVRKLKKVKGVGPEGWSQAIAEYVKD